MRVYFNGASPRVLGPEQYGIYSYVLAIVSILAIPAMFGLPSLIVRETAKAEVKQEWGKMRGLWFWANSLTVSLSIIIALITAVVLWLNRDNFTQMQFFTFAWGIAFIPLSALAALRNASLLSYTVEYSCMTGIAEAMPLYVGYIK